MSTALSDGGEEWAAVLRSRSHSRAPIEVATKEESMAYRKMLIGLVFAAAGFATAVVSGRDARAQAPKPPAPAAGAAPAAAKPTCAKQFGKNCCDPEVAAHLPKDAVFKACGESDATFLGESGSKETCKYHFKVEGEKAEDTYVQVYVPAQKEVMQSPNDPFFSYKKVGKVYVTDKAKSPKSAPMAAAQTGLYLPGKGYSVSVSASTKVCSKPEATKLAGSMK